MVKRRMYRAPSGAVSAWVEFCLTRGWVPFKSFVLQWENRVRFKRALDFERRALDVMWQVEQGLLRPRHLDDDTYNQPKEE